MTEHLTNVQHELVSTQQLVDGKKKEVAIGTSSGTAATGFRTPPAKLLHLVHDLLRLQNGLRVVEFSKRFQMIP